MAAERYLAGSILGKRGLLWKLESPAVRREEDVCTGPAFLRGARRDRSETVCQHTAASD